MKSASLSIQTLVIPDLIRDKAVLGGLFTAGGVAKGGGTPDQVRGDEAGVMTE